METEQILFSIVVPVYNVEQYLEDCITSITGQIDDTKLRRDFADR